MSGGSRLHGKEIPFRVASPLSLDKDERPPLAADGGPAQGGLYYVQNDNVVDLTTALRSRVRGVWAGVLWGRTALA
jgi:hypothetical protein